MEAQMQRERGPGRLPQSPWFVYLGGSVCSRLVFSSRPGGPHWKPQDPARMSLGVQRVFDTFLTPCRQAPCPFLREMPSLPPAVPNLPMLSASGGLRRELGDLAEHLPCSPGQRRKRTSPPSVLLALPVTCGTLGCRKLCPVLPRPRLSPSLGD